MGEVYLGQDTKLDRKVALKVLPADSGYVVSADGHRFLFVSVTQELPTLQHSVVISWAAYVKK